MNENYSKLVDIAFQMHSSGKLYEAKLVYEKLLALNPDSLEVQNLYAQLNYSLKNYEISLKFFSNIFSKTNLIDIANMALNCALKLDDFKSAVYFSEKLIEVYPDSFVYYYNHSVSLKKLNLIDRSIQSALKAYNLNKRHFSLNIHLSSLYEEINDLNSAILYLENALDIEYCEDVLFNLGVLYKKSEKYEVAIEYFDKVIKLNPNNKNAMINIANTYKKINLSEALDIYKDIEKIYPDDLLIKFFIYNVYYEMQDFKNAIIVAEELLNIEQNNFIYYKMIGDCYFEMYEYNKALELYNIANSIQPNDESIVRSLVEIYYINSELQKAEEFLNSINRSIDDFIDIKLKARDIDSVKSKYKEINTALRSEDSKRKRAINIFYKLNISEKFNVTEEEFISNTAEIYDNKNMKYVDFAKKDLKLSDDYTNKNLLVYSMHGIGDFLMFSRYLNILKEKAKSILLYIPKSIERIVRESFPYASIYTDEKILTSDLYDYSIPEMISICFYDSGLKEIPFSSGYLKVNNDLIVEKSKFDFMKTDKKKIGIFWQGNPTVMLNRSVKLKYFLPLFENENLQFFSFQLSKIDDESEMLKKELPIIDLSQYINDYADTAAFLKNIDLLISIDTSIANLAGAIGVKTFLLLPYDTEWRWFTDEETTPWYDSVRLFKQREPNNWEEVISRIKNEL